MLVSIICATYNHETVIKRCIDSVLGQDFVEWELIIVDDGSTDNTAAIVDEYCSKDSRIKVIHQAHNGIWKLCENYNAALYRASGTLIAILEGDDFWPEWKLTNQVALHKMDVILSYGRATIYDGTYHDSKAPPFQGSLSSQDFMKYLLTRQAAIVPVTMIIQRDALTKIGGFKCHNSYPATDFPTILELSQLAGNIVWSSACLGYYSIHSNQVTKTLGVEIAMGALIIKREFFDGNAVFASLREESQAADQRILSDAYLAQARYGLLNRDKSVVKIAIIGLWKYGGRKRKIQAIYSFVAMYTGWTMEPILKMVKYMLNIDT